MKKYINVFSFPLLATMITTLFFLRWREAFPFLRTTVNPNYETFNAYGAYIVYAKEALSLPIGKISSLGFPHDSVSIGNTGTLPLFAVIGKLLGKVFPFFQEINYVPIVETLSVGLSVFFVILILRRFYIKDFSIYLIASVLTVLTPATFANSLTGQSFNVLASCFYLAWLAIIVRMGTENFKHSLKFLPLLFSVAVLADFYAFVCLAIMTGAVLTITGIAWIANDKGKEHFYYFPKHTLYFAGSMVASVFCLYAIGLYPLPPLHFSFSSFEFGFGGRYHVADILSFFIAPGSDQAGRFSIPFLSYLGWPLTTKSLAPGQFVGIVFPGSAGILLFLTIVIATLSRRFSLKNVSTHVYIVSLSVFTAYVFSLGYQFYLLGKPIEFIPLTPAGLAAEVFKPLFNIRVPGRLNLPALQWALLLSSIFLARIFNKRLLTGVAVILCLLHITETLPVAFSKSTINKQKFPNPWATSEVDKLKTFVSDTQILFFAPRIEASTAEWVKDAYSIVITTGKKSNIFYVARFSQEQSEITNRDIQDILQGNIAEVEQRYKEHGKFSFVLRSDIAKKVLSRIHVPIKKAEFNGFVLIKLDAKTHRGNE